MMHPQRANAKLYLIFDAAGVVDHTDTSGVGSHVQPLDDLGQEDFDLLEF